MDRCSRQRSRAIVLRGGMPCLAAGQLLAAPACPPAQGGLPGTVRAAKPWSGGPSGAPPHGGTARAGRLKPRSSRSARWSPGARMQRSEVVPPAADRVTGHPEHRQDETYHDGNDADRPDNGDSGDEPDNEEDDAENDQVGLLSGSRRAARRQENIRMLFRSNRITRTAARGAGPARSPMTGGLLHFPALLIAALPLAGPDVPEAARRPRSGVALTHQPGPLPVPRDCS